LLAPRTRGRRGWTIGGVDARTREAVAAAEEAGMPVGAWVGKALAEGLEAGVSVEEIEARVRAVVTQELEPVRQALLQGRRMRLACHQHGH
jgi:hypothetical protein